MPTDDEVERLADEAERGYDVARLRYTIRVEPDPPVLYVVYQGGRRIRQFETRDAAETFIRGEDQ